MKTLALAATFCLLLGCDEISRRASDAKESPLPAPAAIPSPSQSLTTMQKFELKKSCMEQGQREWKEIRAGTPRGITLGTFYCYSEKLNTCLYSDTYREGKAVISQVLDLATGEVLAMYMNGPEGTDRPAQQEFNAKKDDLLSTCLK